MPARLLASGDSPPTSAAHALSCLPLHLRLAHLFPLVGFPTDAPLPIDLADVQQAEEHLAAFLTAAATLLPLDVWGEEGTLTGEVLPWFLETIPLAPLGMDDCQFPPDCYREPLPLLLLLAALEDDPREPHLRAAFEATYPSFTLPEELALSTLISPLTDLALPAPLDALPLAIQYLAHETGNFFLDECPYCFEPDPAHFPWTAEMVALLHAEWTEAQAQDARLVALLEWVEAEARGLDQVWSALLRAHYHEAFADEYNLRYREVP